MSRSAESAYRSALRWYPRSWRAANGDALLGTLLDLADADSRDRPRASERIDLAVNGICARFGMVAGLLPAGTLAIASPLALGTGASLAVTRVLLWEWTPWSDAYRLQSPVVFGPFLTPAVLLFLLWVVAFACAAGGLAFVSRALVGLALLSSAVVLPLSASWGFVWSMEGPDGPADDFFVSFLPDELTLLFLALLGVLVLAGPRSPRRRGVFWAAAAASIVAFSAWSAVPDGGIRDGYPVDDAGLWVDDRAMTLIVSAILIVSLLLFAARRRAAASAMTLFAGLWAITLVASVLRSHGFGRGSLLGQFVAYGALTGSAIIVIAIVVWATLRLRRA